MFQRYKQRISKLTTEIKHKTNDLANLETRIGKTKEIIEGELKKDQTKIDNLRKICAEETKRFDTMFRDKRTELAALDKEFKEKTEAEKAKIYFEYAKVLAMAGAGKAPYVPTPSTYYRG